MSGAGKTTLGARLAQELGYMFLDSDVIRQVLNIPCDFSIEGRLRYQETLRGYVKDQQQKGNNIIVASITPLQEMRNKNAQLLDNYTEVYLECCINALSARDPKGFYKKACEGVMCDFTGISSPFEPPVYYCPKIKHTPKLTINTGDLGEEESYQILVNTTRYLINKGDNK